MDLWSKVMSLKLWFLFRVSAAHHIPYLNFELGFIRLKLKWVFCPKLCLLKIRFRYVSTSSLWVAPPQLLLSYARQRRRNSFFFMLRRRHSVRSQRRAKKMMTLAAMSTSEALGFFLGPRHGSRRPMDRRITPIGWESDPATNPTHFLLKRL